MMMSKRGKTKAKNKSSSRGSKKTKNRRVTRVNKNSKRESKLQSEVAASLYKQFLKEVENESKSKRPKKSAGKSNRKNANNSKKKSEKRKIYSKKFNVYSIVDKISRSVIEFKINLAKKHQIDIFDFSNQDESNIVDMIWPYFEKLLVNVRKESEHFRIMLEWQDSNKESDFISTSMHDYDDIPYAVLSRLDYLIKALFKEVKKYKKNHSSFILKSCLLVRYTKLPNKKKKKK